MDRGIIVDTNVPLEILFRQENAELASQFLETKHNLYITDFSLRSIFIASKRNSIDIVLLRKFIKLLINTSKMLRLEDKDLFKVYKIAESKELSFDDAHLYYLANKHKFSIATFDAHLLKFPKISVNPTYLIR